MRIAHIADTHLGYRSGTTPRRDEDFAASWIQACRDIVQAEPDLVLHAGDVFHRPNPSWGAVKTFLDGAEILEGTHAPVLGISGNHDSSRIMTKNNVFNVLGGVLTNLDISYDDFPVIDRPRGLNTTIVRLSHQALLARDLKEKWEYAVSQLGDTQYTILVAHGGVLSLEKSQEQGSFDIPDFVFDYPWDYAALGHLHMAQPFGKRGWYSGSIERCGWSDILAEPAWTLVTLSDGKVRHEQRALPHVRFLQLPEIKCDGDEEVDILASVLTSLGDSRLSVSERTLSRVKLIGVHPFKRRVIQSSIQRVVKDLYPNVVFQVEAESRIWLDDDPGDAPQEKDIQSVEEMFIDFVQSRTFQDPEIPAKLLEVGSAALAKARAREETQES